MKAPQVIPQTDDLQAYFTAFGSFLLEVLVEYDNGMG